MFSRQLIAVLSVVTLSSSAFAGSLTDNIDQQQFDKTGFSLASFGSVLAQSFTPSQNNINAAAAYLSADPASPTIARIGVFDDVTKAGNLSDSLAQGFTEVTTGGWFSVSFAPIELTLPTYYLSFFIDNAAGGIGLNGGFDSLGDPAYSGGVAYLDGGAFGIADFAFQTGYDPNYIPGGGNIIPSPAAAGAGLIGLVGLVGRRRRA